MSKALQAELEHIEEEFGIEHGRIELFADEEGTGVMIDGELWSNSITDEEAIDTLICIAKGYRMAMERS